MNVYINLSGSLTLFNRCIPLWVGARGVEFDWKYIQMSLDSNISLVMIFARIILKFLKNMCFYCLNIWNWLTWIVIVYRIFVLNSILCTPCIYVSWGQLYSCCCVLICIFFCFSSYQVHYIAMAAVVWMFTRYDLPKSFRPPVTILLGLCVYKGFLMEWVLFILIIYFRTDFDAVFISSCGEVVAVVLNIHSFFILKYY